MTTEKKLLPYTAFILHENGTWDQPVFWAHELPPSDSKDFRAAEDSLSDALLAHYGRRYIAALDIGTDFGCSPENVEDIGYGVGSPDYFKADEDVANEIMRAMRGRS